MRRMGKMNLESMQITPMQKAAVLIEALPYI